MLLAEKYYVIIIIDYIITLYIKRYLSITPSITGDDLLSWLLYIMDRNARLYLECRGTSGMVQQTTGSRLAFGNNVITAYLRMLALLPAGSRRMFSLRRRMNV